MHIHIVGICGTFMAGIATLAKELGHKVTGMDQGVYPPMSDYLRDLNIDVTEGYSVNELPSADIYIIGNVMSRGNELIEHILNESLNFMSGPEWLHDTLLKDRWVLGVAGTHGKTTTTAMLAWILESADLNPGFLIGGVPNNFDVSARLGSAPFFVIEADEYDTAFFDKRSKFVHYNIKTAILNNLEFDHADIFEDLAAIQAQFNYLVRTVPGEGLIITPSDCDALDEVLDMGCWTPRTDFGLSSDPSLAWRAERRDGQDLEVFVRGESLGQVSWPMIGDYNVENGLAACAAAEHAGVNPLDAVNALEHFAGVARRQELIGVMNDVTLYDDFAHHPTAIEKTLKGIRAQMDAGKLWALVEPASNTMKSGVHKQTLAPSLRDADKVLMYQSAAVKWDLMQAAQTLTHASVHTSIEPMIEDVVKGVEPGDHVVIMSNGGFEGMRDKLHRALSSSN